MIIDSNQNPSRVIATQWQHTLVQRQRLGKREKQNCRHLIGFKMNLANNHPGFATPPTEGNFPA
jgi:hypothetical protein